MNALRIIPTLFSIVACVMIFSLPNGVMSSYANATICIITSGLYFASTHQLWSGEKGWKFDFSLGIVWLLNAMLHIIVLIAAHLPKPE